MKKIIYSFVALALVFSFQPSVAKAQTVQELQAQITSLLETIRQLQVILAMQVGTQVPTTTVYTRDLTIGSRGADVVALQQFLVARGHLVMPPGVAFGYFGPLTQAALGRFQAANGISPTAGYFGPITRARLNSMLPPTTPGTGTPTTPGTGITTPGAEGILSVTKNPTPSSGTSIREGETREPLLALRVEARNSDLAVQRVKVDLGTETEVFTRQFSRIYLMDGSTVIAESALNSSTVFEEGNTKFVQITGFNWIVPKDSTRVLTIAADLFGTIESGAQGSETIALAPNGIRALDGAGIDHQAPSSSISNSVNIGSSLSENADLILSLSANSPGSQEIVASEGSTEDEFDELELARFDLRAERDDVAVTSLGLNITKTGGGTATATTVYLYDGSTLLGSEVVESSGESTLDDVDFTVTRNSTRTISVRADIRDANSTGATLQVSVDGDDIQAENSLGDDVDVTGSATSDLITIRNVGPQITLLSKSITKGSTPVNNNTSTSTAQANFVLRVRAIGSDVTFGNTASTTYPMVSNGTGAPARSFVIYAGGAASNPSVASSTSITIPNGVVTSGLTNSFTVQEGNTVDIPVSFLFEGRTAGGSFISTGSYAVGLERVNWVANGAQGATTFMAGDNDWRTSDISMP